MDKDIFPNLSRNNFFQNIELYAKSAQITKDIGLKDSLMENILASAKEYFNTNHGD